MAGFVAVKFKGEAMAFDEVAKQQIYESSGTEHSPAPPMVESLTHLSRLVNSCLEGETTEKLEEIDGNADANCFDELENLRIFLNYDENFVDDLKRSIIEVVENALLVGEAKERSSPEFKQWLMIQLLDRGFNAGLCKSKWEKAHNSMSGSYECIVVNVDDNSHYIMEVALAGEFDIAHATPCYASLLKKFPQVFVGKEEEWKQVVKIMSRAMKKSMKKKDIYVPPWRRLAYMEAKWFGSYKRTTNEKSSFDSLSSSKKRNVGFALMGAISFYCRENITASNSDIKMGNLAAALSG